MQESVVKLTSRIRVAMEAMGFEKTTAHHADNSLTYYTDIKTGERFAVVVALAANISAPEEILHKEKY